MSQPQLDALQDWARSDLFSERERAVLAYADAMTLHVQVPDAIFAAVSAQFEPQQLVELTATVAAYNMVSRFLEALQIHSHDAR
jgi:alkylhydroperoxidase family enzyme